MYECKLPTFSRDLRDGIRFQILPQDRVIFIKSTSTVVIVELPIGDIDYKLSVDKDTFYKNFKKL